MAENEVAPSGTTSPAGGEPKTEAQAVPLSKSDLEALLDAKLRSLQSGTDKQIARTAAEYRQQIEALREELGATTRGLLDVSAADDDTKKVVGERMDKERAAARETGNTFKQRVAYIEDALAKAGLSEGDLPHDVEDYAQHPNPDMFNKAIARAQAQKAKAAPAPKATSEVEQLKAEIAEMKTKLRQATGEDVVPDGGSGTVGKTHATADDWTREEIAAILKRGGR